MGVVVEKTGCSLNKLREQRFSSLGQFLPTPRKDQVRDLDGSKLGNPSTQPVLRAPPPWLRSPLYEGANQKLVKRTAVLCTVSYRGEPERSGEANALDRKTGSGQS